MQILIYITLFADKKQTFKKEKKKKISLYTFTETAHNFLNFSISLSFKRENNTIIMSINRLFFQDRHSEIVNYPFKIGYKFQKSFPSYEMLNLFWRWHLKDINEQNHGYF